MPNPKLGSVTTAISSAIQTARQGEVQYKTDKFGIIHTAVGMLSFTEQQLITNINSLVSAIIAAKPIGAKGEYIKSAYLASPQGPGIPLDITVYPFRRERERRDAALAIQPQPQPQPHHKHECQHRYNRR